MRRVASALLCAALVAGCSGASTSSKAERAQGAGSARGPAEVVVYTSVDQVFSQPVFERCEREAHLAVRAVYDTEETKSTGVLNRLIAEGDAPVADVFWSGDPVRPFSLVRRGLVQPYRSPAAERIPPAFRAEDGTWTGFAARARVLLVNTEQVPPDRMPTSVRDLAAPAWRGRAALANPLFGTTTIHAAALFAAWGDEAARGFFEALSDNGVRIASSNGEVRRLVVAGEVAFGLTDTDDAHEAVEEGAKVAVVYPDQTAPEGGTPLGTLVMPTAVVLLKGAPHPEAGKRLVDCLLAPQTERMLTRAGAHMPLGKDVPAPEGLRTVDSLRAMKVDYADVARTMEEIQPFLRSWVGL